MFESTQQMYTRMREAFLANRDIAYWPLLVWAGELTDDHNRQQRLMRQVVEIITGIEKEPTAAHAVKGLLSEHQEIIAKKLAGRTNLIVAQVLPSIEGTRILDFGCQSGDIAYELYKRSPNLNISLYDVHDDRSDQVKEKGFQFSTDWETYAGERFDTALMITVAHHCDDPDRELDRVAQVADRIVMIESVVSPIMPWAAQACMDWIYNRGIANNPVPGNFRTSEEWDISLRKWGYRSIFINPLGVDLRIVPEFHELFDGKR